MKHVAIFAFVLALVGGGVFLLGVSTGVDSLEMTGFILTLPITLIAALGLAATAIGLAGALLMAACSSLAWSWAWACGWLRRTRG